MKTFVALTLYQMNRNEEAFKFYDLAIQKNPENSDYFYQKGRINHA